MILIPEITNKLQQQFYSLSSKFSQTAHFFSFLWMNYWEELKSREILWELDGILLFQLSRYFLIQTENIKLFRISRITMQHKLEISSRCLLICMIGT